MDDYEWAECEEYAKEQVKKDREARTIEWNEREKKLYLDFHLGIARDKRKDDLRRACDLLYSAYEGLEGYLGHAYTNEQEIIRQAFKDAKEATIELGHLMTPDH